MGQREILECLENKSWKTKTEIICILKDFNLYFSGVNNSLKRLVDGGFLETKDCPELKHGFLYRIKVEEDD